MPRQKLTFDKIMVLIFNELRWLLVPIVSLCICLGGTFISLALFIGPQFEVSSPAFEVAFETIIFTLSFLVGAIVAPRWRIFSIVPQYFFLGYFGWDIYRKGQEDWRIHKINLLGIHSQRNSNENSCGYHFSNYHLATRAILEKAATAPNGQSSLRDFTERAD